MPPGDDEDLDLFTLLAQEPSASARHHQLREEAIRRHLPLVHWCVNDFGPRRDLRDDIVQVGTIGLIHAVDRFDPHRGVAFPAFARPTIKGEILRYFRDRDPAIRLPRRYHDITHAVRSSREHVQHDLGREASLGDLAAFLDLPLADVETAFAAESACAVRSLDYADADPWGRPLHYGAVDAQLEAVPDHQALRESLWRLSRDERTVIAMLFWHGLTQDQAAAHLGKSQMYVSRTLRRASRHLRELLSS
ncbi:MAG: sigma-70 family RNA polymerase sigma factor [Marmoricola sp.]